MLAASSPPAWTSSRRIFHDWIRLDGYRRARSLGKRRLQRGHPRSHQAQVMKDRRRRPVEQLAAVRGLNDRRRLVQGNPPIEDVHIAIPPQSFSNRILSRGGEWPNR
jgi:hypothetical protein